MTTLTSCSQTTTQHTFGIHRWSYSFLPSYFLLQNVSFSFALFWCLSVCLCVYVWGLVRVSLAVTLIIQYDSGLGCVFFMPLLATCCDYIYIVALPTSGWTVCDAFVWIAERQGSSCSTTLTDKMLSPNFVGMLKIYYY